jgi:hypothetical protein
VRATTRAKNRRKGKWIVHNRGRRELRRWIWVEMEVVEGGESTKEGDIEQICKASWDQAGSSKGKRTTNLDQRRTRQLQVASVRLSRTDSSQQRLSRPYTSKARYRIPSQHPIVFYHSSPDLDETWRAKGGRKALTWRTIHQRSLGRLDTQSLELVRLLHRKNASYTGSSVSCAFGSHSEKKGRRDTHMASTSSSICLSKPPISVYVPVGLSSTSIAFTRESYSAFPTPQTD